MRDLIVVHLLLVPNILLGFASRSGKFAGYYVLMALIVLPVIAGLFSIEFYIYATFVIAAVAVLLRDRLRISEWFKGKR